MMPEAYKRGAVTQTVGTCHGEHSYENDARQTSVLQRHFLAGTKPLEVRIGYGNIKGIKKGEHIRLGGVAPSRIVEVADVRIYPTFCRDARA